jgi:hypothetical protein
MLDLELLHNILLFMCTKPLEEITDSVFRAAGRKSVHLYAVTSCETTEVKSRITKMSICLVHYCTFQKYIPCAYENTHTHIHTQNTVCPHNYILNQE